MIEEIVMESLEDLHSGKAALRTLMVLLPLAKDCLPLLDVGAGLCICVSPVPGISIATVEFLMCQDHDSCTILYTDIIITIFVFWGLTANLLIVIFSCKNWMKSHRIVSSDKILFSVGIARFLMMGLFLLNSFCSFSSPALLRSVHVSTFLLVSYVFLDSCSLWFVTLLNTLYCVKISNFQHSVFLQLKQNLPAKIPGLLVVCVLISAFTTFPYVVLRQTSPTPESVVGKNGTELDLKADLLFLMTSYVLSSSLQLIMNVTSASLLIHSLRRHILKMQRNATDFWNPQTEANVRAMKLLICFLVLYIPYSVVSQFIYFLSSFRMSLGIRLICVAVSTLYHPGHSVLIILTHPKLKTEVKQIFCFNKKNFRYH